MLSECDSNLCFLDWTINQVQINRNDPEHRFFTALRFRGPAVELLITNRYVEEDQLFFSLADEYLNGIIALNEKLNFWEHSPEATEDWFLQNEKKKLNIFNKFKSEVEDCHKKLIEQF